MAKYYNADTLLEFVKNNTPTINGHTTMKCVERAINEAPTDDVREVKRGHWKDRYNNKYYNHLYECSVCGREALCKPYSNELGHTKIRQELTPVCPHCGADMRGEEDGKVY